MDTCIPLGYPCETPQGATQLPCCNAKAQCIGGSSPMDGPPKCLLKTPAPTCIPTSTSTCAPLQKYVGHLSENYVSSSAQTLDCKNIGTCSKENVKNISNDWIQLQTTSLIIGIILLFMTLCKCLKLMAESGN